MRTLVDLLRKRADSENDRLAYSFIQDDAAGRASLTYGELDAQARRIAARLQSLRARGERILIVYPAGLDYVCAFFGCLYAGAIAVPVYPPTNQRGLPRFQSILIDSGATVILTTSALCTKTRELLESTHYKKRLTWLCSDGVEEDTAEAWKPPRLDAEHTAFLQYTSGSTAAPKGVVLSHRNLLYNQKMIKLGFRSSKDSVVVGWLPLYHDMGLIGNVLHPLYLGCSCVLLSPAYALNHPYNWLKAIADCRGTISGGPNFAYQLCVDKITEEQRDTLDLSSWNVAFNGAEPIRADTLSRFAEVFGGCGFRPEAFYPCYGLAEASLFVSGRRTVGAPVPLSVAADALAANRVLACDQPNTKTRRLVGCGHSHLDEVVAIVNPETRRICTDSEIGEIWVSGRHVARGYWGNPKETRRTFDAHTADTGDGPFLRTGDLGFLRDGELFITGRLKDLIILSGKNLYPQDIESTAERSHPALRFNSTAAFAVETPSGEQLVVVHELGLRKKPDPQDVFDAVQGSLFDEHGVVAHDIVLLKAGTIPKTSSGKIRRSTARSRYAGGTFEPVASLRALRSEVGYVAPRTPTEKRLASIWAAALKQDRIGLHDNFFHLGGHSLLATQVISRVRSHWGVELGVGTLFEAPTLQRFAQALEAAQAGAAAGASLGAMVPADRSGELALSFAQQRLWFLDQLQPGNAFYNVAAAVRLTGELERAALEQALGEIVRRHEALRTRFPSVAGSPRQVIAAQLRIGLALEDLSHGAPAQREARARELAQQEAMRPFDLAAGPLIRSGLIRLGERDHVLLLTLHHIVADGWSMGILVKEIGALYSAYAQGRGSPLPELERHYADFVQWQRQWLQGEVLERQVRYWRQQLAGAPGVLELPTDRLRPALRSYRGARLGWRVSRELSEGLRQLARQGQATLFMVLAAAFNVLLYRYSGQDDICIGTPIANRNRAEIEPLIGFFVNTLVLRTRLQGNPRFQELLQQVRHNALQAYAHQDVPFEHLVDALEPERHLSHTPLFQVMLVLQNVPMPALELAGLESQVLSSEASVAKFDLTLSLEEGPQGLAGEWEYNSDLFDRETIARMAGHFEALLEALVADPGARIGELPMLKPEERQRLLLQWNDTARDYAREQSIAQLFEAQVERTPEAIALEFGQQQLSYAELNARANQLAHHLRSLGIGPDVLVGLCLERSLEMVIGLLGILKAGGAYVPLDPAYPKERLAYMLEDARPAVLLTQQHLRAALPEPSSSISVFCFDRDWAGLQRESKKNPRRHALPDNLAYVIYTSGSTGRPKGVGIRHASAAVLVHWAGEQYSRDQLATVLFATSICFDLSVFELFVPLSYGGKVLMAGDVLEVGNLSGREAVTLINTVPSAMAQLVAMGDVPASVATINLAGEPFDRRLVEDIYAKTRARRLINLYGPSEDTTYSTVAAIGRDDRVTIGRPIANTHIYLLDAHLHPVPVGIPGELYIGGEGLARGYLKRPSLTAEKFIPNPFSSEPGARMYRSGDRARYLPDGNIDFLGRIDHQVKLRGFRIELGEIEAALGRLPAVREAVVLAREDIPGDKRLVAYVRGQPGAAAPDAVQLRLALQHSLPQYMIPAHFVVLEQLPLTPNGKVDRKALPAPVDGMRSDLGYVAPHTATEATLASIWAEVLKLGRVGMHDHFFHLGGHSLLATQVISRIRSGFGLELPLRTLFEAPTLQGLAQQIDAAAAGSAAPPIVPGDRSAALPLSFAQQRLWFLDQFQPGSAFYNMPAAVRLAGLLNRAALAQALNEIVRRHEALRTTFHSVDGSAVQVVAAAREIPLPVIDLSDLPEAQREAQARSLAQQAAMRPFDLAAGPLLRAGLIRLAERDHLVLLTLHHIVSDGWSMGILVRELTALYNAYAQGLASPLPEPALQYADFAQWQRQWLQGEVLEQQVRYWKRQLEGAPVLLELPTDRPRPAVQSYRGSRLDFALSSPTSAGLYRLSKQTGATLFMTLAAAFNVLLYRYCRQSDICIGTPIANRNRAEIEPLIGFFVNTLVLRTRLQGNPRFQELLQQVRHNALQAYAHQDVPFEHLVDALEPERHLSHAPLFQVMFALQNAPMQRFESPGLVLQVVASETRIAKFDLTLTVEEGGGEALFAAFEYNSDLFDRETIARMAGHFEALLEALVADPGARIGELPMLKPEERQRLLLQWNDTARDYAREQSIAQLFEAQVERTPEAIALEFGQQQLSYAELNARANQLAHHLRSLGIGPDVLVGLCLERSLEMVIGLLGILKAGGAYVPLDPAYPKERLAYMLEDARPAVLLTQQHLRAALPEPSSSISVFCFDRDWAGLQRKSKKNPRRHALPDNLAYVIYTSGSTGRPKGVVVTHRGVVRLVTQDTYAEINSGDRVLQLATYVFDAVTFEIWGALVTGARLVLAPEEMLLPDKLSAFLQAHDITTLFMTTALFNQLVEVAPQAISGLKRLLFGGEAVSVPHVVKAQAYDRRLCLTHVYGPTESTTFSSYCHLSEVRTGDCVPIGRPIADTQIYLLDTHLHPVPVGIPGELYIGGEGLARGYLNRAALTAEKFIPHPFSPTPGARMYRSGDLARYRPDGNIEFLGRIDHQVKIRGFRIELGEIEATLRRVPAVREAIVLAREDAPGDKRLVAYVVANEGEAEISSVRAALQQSLPQYMIPAHFVLLEQLPLNANGKIDRKALPAPDATRSEVGYVAPRTPTEERLARIWAAVLKRDKVGIHDNFFEIGGDSILTIQIIAQARQVGLHIAAKELFQYPSIAQLMPVIRTGSTIAAEQGLVCGPVPLTPIQRWLFAQHLPALHHFNQSLLLRVLQPLDPRALEEAVEALIHHHDALRLRFIHTDSAWQQWHADVTAPSGAVVTFDWAPLSDAEQAAAIETWADSLQAGFDLARGPLLRVAYFKLGPRLGRLLLVCHHLVIDGVSWRILMEDLHTAYRQRLQGQAVSLPPKTSSFQRWAERLHAYADSSALARELDFWIPRATSCGAPLAVDFPEGGNSVAATAVVTIQLSAQDTASLLSQVPAAYRTQINDVLLTALAFACNDWTGADALGVDVEGHGREDLFEEIDVSRTIGWFTALYPVRLDLGGTHDYGTGLKAIKEQLRAIPNKGIGYGLLRYLCDHPALRDQAFTPPISFNYLGQFDQMLEGSALLGLATEMHGSDHGPVNTRAHEIDITAISVAGRLNVSWRYSKERFRGPTIETLAQRYLEHLRGIVRHCLTGAGGYTPSDFPLAGLDQEKLDKLLNQLKLPARL